MIEARDRSVRAFRRLVILSLRLRPRAFGGMALAIGFGVMALGLALAIGLGPSRALKQHMRRIFPEQRIVLKPASSDILFVKVEMTKITPTILEQVKALPGVERVSPEVTVRFPVRAEGSLFGMTYSTDLTVTGVEPWVLGDDLPENFWWEKDKREWVPAVLSQYFLDLYNMALAESNKLPKLSPNAAIGRDFWVVLGESSIRPSADDSKVRYEECRIVGLSRNPDLLGLVIPLDAVESFNAWWGLANQEFRALHVELANPEAAQDVEKAAEKLGLSVPDRQAPWRRAVLISRIAGSVIATLGLLVLGLAGAYVTLATRVMLKEWKREMAIWRATGASMAVVRRVVVATILLAGMVGAVAGLGGAYGLVSIGRMVYDRLATQWSFLPPDAVQLPPTWSLCLLVALALGLGLMALREMGKALGEPIAAILWQDR
ncbi:MAG: FtsX-like permease family protein [Candidatus Sumerlaeota bacterium]